MNNAFLELSRSLKLQSLTKDEIRKLHGGKFRGQRVFVGIERNLTSCEFHVGKVWNQRQSQDSGLFQEGYVRIRTDQRKMLDYNIARETVDCYQFEFSRDFGIWRKSFNSRKAWILASVPGTAPFELLKQSISRRIAEEGLFSAILNSSSDLQAAAIGIIEDQIGLRIASRPSRNEELGLLWGHYLAHLTVEQMAQLEDLLREDGETTLAMAA